ncbi:MAG: hypothetical protein JNG88_08055 [Phycisphaerales bacterium]|nr:hypothetical protein [Phycisphaerales bacterium]
MRTVAMRVGCTLLAAVALTLGGCTSGVAFFLGELLGGTLPRVNGLIASPGALLFNQLGQTAQIDVVANISDGTTKQLSGQLRRELRFESNNTSVVLVDENGLVTAVGDGNAEIRINTGKFEATVAAAVEVAQSGARLVVVPERADFTQHGQTLQLQVQRRGAVGQVEDITPGAKGTQYESVDTGVAAVSSEGLVTAIGPGETAIRIVNGTFSTALPVRVNSVVSIVVDPSSIAFQAVGETRQLSVRGQRQDGSVESDLTAADLGTTYQSADESVASVSPSGLITAMGIGQTTIQVASGASRSNVNVSVTVLAALELAPTVVTFSEVAQTQQLMLTGHYSDGSVRDLTAQSGVSYVSSDAAVATVDAGGIVRPGVDGTAVITAGFDSLSATCEVTVAIANPQVSSLRIEPSEINFADPAERAQLRVYARLTNGTEQDFTSPDAGTVYVSSELYISTVDASGLAAPVARGVAVLTATNAGISASIPVNVTYCRPRAPVLEPLVSPTREPSVTVIGRCEPGAALEITTPGGTASAIAGSDGAFAVAVPLALNRANAIFVTAVADCGVRSSTAPVSVTQDGRPPNLYIDAPSDGADITTEVTDVAGRVGDLLSGYQGLTVTVNGITAIVDEGIGNNGTFLAQNVPLPNTGPNNVTATATDAAGNQTTRTITVTRIEIPAKAIRMAAVSGNGQTARVMEWLENPIVVRMTRPDGSPFANKVVTFEVTRSDGRLAIEPTGHGEPMLQARTDANGLVQAFWMLGSDAGCGNNRISVTSQGVAGTVGFCASALPGPAAQINIGTGNMQRGDAGGPAPEPLRAWVSDSCNGIENVPVTFRVVAGGGKVNGVDEITIVTSRTGHAQVDFTFGADGGNNVVEADFPGHAGQPATFALFGLVRDSSRPTAMSGLILDNSNGRVGNIGVRMRVGTTTLSTTADDEGQFRFDDVPGSGHAHLYIDAFAAPDPHLNGLSVPVGTFPNMHYELVIAPNAENSIGMPILLPPLNPANIVEYRTGSNIELTCAGMAGLKMIVTAGSMSLPNGDGTFTPAPDHTPMSLNQVHHDDIPMPMPDGAAPPFAWTLQPAGAHFDPPVRIEYPNMSGLPPGAIANFLSFDHDTNRFEIVASGSVSEDGSIIVTDRGAGLSVSGWGCNCPPYSVTGDCCNECTALGPCETCTSNGTLSGGTVSVAPASPNVGDTIVFTASGVVDSGGGKSSTCPPSSNPIPPGTVTYRWEITKPDGTTTSGAGASASISATTVGRYSCAFTAEVTRDCPPPPLNLPARNACAGSGLLPTSLASVNYIEQVIAPSGPPWGAMRPTTWAVDITAYFDCASDSWKARVTQADSTYTIWWRLLAGISEASAAAATDANHCNMIADLNALGNRAGRAWYMLAAVEAHERVHVTEWRTSLDPKFATMKTTIEALSVPRASAADAAAARTAIRALPAYQTAVDAADNDAQTVFWAIPDPNGNTDAAEHAVVDPVITAIRARETAEGWTVCPP